MQTAFSVFLSFGVYSFLGWVCETFYCSVGQRHFVNRGFLFGPVCPVYGFGALAVLYLLAPFTRQPILLFIAAMVVTSLLEYLTGFLLEKLFHTKWWDYSTYRFNLHGRVCLKNSLLFGLIALIMVLFINPAVQRGLSQLSPPVSAAFSLLLAAAFMADTVQSVRSALALSRKAEQLFALRAELREKSAAYREALQQFISLQAADSEELRAAIREKLDALPRKKHSEPVSEALHARLEELRAHTEALYAGFSQLYQRRERLTDSANSHRRLLTAFPGMRSLRHEGILEELRLSLKERKNQRNAE